MYGKSWLCMEVFVVMLLIQRDNPQYDSHTNLVRQSHQFGVIITPIWCDIHTHMSHRGRLFCDSKSMIITISMQGKVLGDYEHSLTKLNNSSSRSLDLISFLRWGLGLSRWVDHGVQHLHMMCRKFIICSEL